MMTQSVERQSRTAWAARRSVSCDQKTPRCEPQRRGPVGTMRVAVMRLVDTACYLATGRIVVRERLHSEGKRRLAAHCAVVFRQERDPLSLWAAPRLLTAGVVGFAL
jgi:hypothetical protein